MPLPVIHQNNIKIYNVSGYDRAKLPDWLLMRHRKSLKKDPEFSQRIELIQDFEFPEASNQVTFTPDEKFIVSTGVYKPQIRVYELGELSIKFERHLNAENVKLRVLDDDWTKLLLLQSDRSLEFHTQGGIYYSTRIPKFGRDLVYDKPTCDVIAVGSTNEAFRLNLDQGRFLKAWETSISEINVVRINPLHRLAALGGTKGMIEYWDVRHRKSVGGLHVEAVSGQSTEVTCIEYLPDGLTIAVGDADGLIRLYDLRNGKPYFTKDHQYGYPINNICYEPDGNYILSADKKVIKIWQPFQSSHGKSPGLVENSSGSILASIEPPHPINDLAHQRNTGIFICANDGIQLQSFYIPALGPAPKWCSFLDHLTEELEESSLSLRGKPGSNMTLYDNYKFITRAELRNLGLDHLVGSSLLRAYMHGFFIDFRLYEKAKAIANPFAYEEYKRHKVQQKIERERSTRISTISTKALLRKLPKVNRALAEKLLASSHRQRDKSNNDVNVNLTAKDDSRFDNPLGDERFKELFIDEDFMIDEESDEWKLLHPSETRERENAKERGLSNKAPPFASDGYTEKEDPGSDSLED